MMTKTLKFIPIIKFTDEQFFDFCQFNSDLRLESNNRGELIVNPPTGGDTGRFNSEINADFVIWNRRTKLGKVFDSSTGFKFPNGATRSPDVSWILLERWNQLTPKQQASFPPIVPDFVLELMSQSDTLKDTQDKMKEYIDNGVRLGWLINPKGNFVEIYRPTQPVEVVKMPVKLDGGDVLPGFELNI
ncbi:MAG: Uma2 family endonuclease [Cyanobacteriota bacterium]|nr:Uma2 family endonuclease [Cyanobacteriota bacterium]